MNGRIVRRLAFFGGVAGLLLLIAAVIFSAPGRPAQAADKGEEPDYVASPQDVNIPGSPLSVIVRDTGSYGVYRNGVQQFYGGHAEGAYLWVNGQVWGPEAVPAGNSVNQYTPVSNTISGNGTPGNPWVATTVVNVGATGLQLTQRVTYINGQEYIRNDFVLCNTGGGSPSVHLFHAADLYTGGSDAGYGYYDPATNSIGGYTQARDLYQIFIPISAATHFEEDHYGTIWDDIGDTSGPGAGFRDVYYPNDYFDNGAGLEWVFNAGGCTTRSDYVSFSNRPVIPTPGGTPAATAVPEPELEAFVCIGLMQDPDRTLAPGADFTYTINVANAGPGTAHNTEAVIRLDPNVEILDFRSPSGGSFVSYLDNEEVRVRFGDVAKTASDSALLIARVRPTAPAGAVITSRAIAAWEDKTLPSDRKWSNQITITVGTTADSGLHGLQQHLTVGPGDASPAGTVFTMEGSFFGGEEKVSFWLNTADGKVQAIDDLGVTDKQGALAFAVDTTGLPAGTYSLVAHGLCTNTEGVGVFTIK